MKTPSVDIPVTCDYGRSFVQWEGQSGHRPLCLLGASCKLRFRQGPLREFFLARDCAGERMYVEKDLIYTPVLDFHLVCEPQKEFLMVKFFADEPFEHRVARRVGETTTTQDGRSATIHRMEVILRHFPSVRALHTDAEVAEAILSATPLLGRTSFYGDDETEVIAEYPVTVSNARPNNGSWQVDTGLILLPDFSLKSELTVGLFRQAYLVYNVWDWAEVTFRQPLTARAAGPVVHFSTPRRLVVRNQLFAVVL